MPATHGFCLPIQYGPGSVAAGLHGVEYFSRRTFPPRAAREVLSWALWAGSLAKRA